MNNQSMNQQMQQQQMQQQQGQGQMTPLTEKDLLYVKDLMSWELVAAKKAYQYAHQTMEPECKQAMFQVAQAHQQNVDRLLQHLNQHVQLSVQAQMSGMGTQATQSGAQPVTTHM